MANNSIGEFGDLDRIMTSIVNTWYNGALDSLYVVQENLSTQLIELDSIFVANDSTMDSTARANWQMNYDSIDIQLIAIIDAEQQIISTNATARLSLINSAITMANNLPESTIYEQNVNKIDMIILNTVAIGNTSFTVDQQDDIMDVGAQCPLAGGKIVYAARSLWQLFDNDLGIFNDATNCLSEGYLMRPSHTNSNVKDFSVYPNPAANNLTIALSEQYTTISIECRNILGNIVLKKDYEKGNENIQVDISALSAGNYSITLKSKRGGFWQTKFSVVK